MNKLKDRTIKRLTRVFPFMEHVKLDKWLRRDIDLIDPTVFIMYSKRTRLYELHAASSLYMAGVERLDRTYQTSFKNLDFDIVSFLYENSVERKTMNDQLEKMDEEQEIFKDERDRERKMKTDFLIKVGRDNLKI